MAKLRSTRIIVLEVLALTAWTFGILGLLPDIYAPACQVQITSLEYPTAAGASQTIEIKSHLQITCAPINQNVLARVDVNALDSNRTLSTNSQGIGTIEVRDAPFVKVVNITITNTLQTPVSQLPWKLQVVAWLFAGPDYQGVARQNIQIQVGAGGLRLTTQSSKSSQSSTSASAPSSSSSVLALVAVVVVVGLIGSVMVFMRRRKPQMAATTQEIVQEETKAEAPVPETPQAPEAAQAKPMVPGMVNISTGYPELDRVLAGGLPVGYAILLVSPPCDERDLLFRKIIESCLSKEKTIFFMSRDLGRTQDFANRYRSNFYVFSPQAERIAGSGNVFVIPSVQNLNDVNISFAKASETLAKTDGDKLIIIDLLSDVLLEHKALTTRKWLDIFIAKRKGEGFTVLGVLNPTISSKQDIQTIADLFDGIIEIYERELRERARRFLIVKKMYGRKYVDTELMLDKDKLF